MDKQYLQRNLFKKELDIEQYGEFWDCKWAFQKPTLGDAMAGDEVRKWTGSGAQKILCVLQKRWA